MDQTLANCLEEALFEDNNTHRKSVHELALTYSRRLLQDDEQAE